MLEPMVVKFVSSAEYACLQSIARGELVHTVSRAKLKSDSVEQLVLSAGASYELGSRPRAAFRIPRDATQGIRASALVSVTPPRASSASSPLWMRRRVVELHA